MCVCVCVEIIITYSLQTTVTFKHQIVSSVSMNKTIPAATFFVVFLKSFLFTAKLWSTSHMGSFGTAPSYGHKISPSPQADSLWWWTERRAQWGHSPFHSSLWSALCSCTCWLGLQTDKVSHLTDSPRITHENEVEKHDRSDH